MSARLVLGIETSCDETAAAIVADEGPGTPVRLVSSVVAGQAELHAEYAGVVPEIASRAHVGALLPVVRRALSEAGVGVEGLHAVAVGHRPGLIGSLLVGVSAAKGLAWSLDVPLLGVDHVHAHLYAGLLSPHACGDRADRAPRALAAPSDPYPALGLVVSGGHTALYVLRAPTELTRIGATIDDALGEAFDKAATILGLPHPGGPNLDALASRPGANGRAVRLPIARLGRDSLDMSFSGLKTALLYAVRGTPGRGTVGPQGYERSEADLTDAARRDFAASFQRAAVEAVMLKLTRALDRFESLAGAPCRTVLTGGGVTANSLLRRRLMEFGNEHAVPVIVPEPALCVDNAAMIAGLGVELLRAGHKADLTLSPVPTTAC